jgi:hypothetical protein
MDELKTLESLGFTMPGPAYLLGMILFSTLGWAAYRYGKKASNIIVKWLGVALMLFPYAIDETWLLYAVGAGLCFGLYVYRR